MRVFRHIAALVMLLVALPAFAASNSADLPHVHVQLISPDAQLHPGAANNAGLYFKLEPGWHVYWKNPGDAGEPPHVKWTLPRGITAGPLQFPVPKRLPLGPLMDFGYEDEVLFPIQLNVAGGAPSGPATLHAKVDWLVCRGSCIPEKAELELTRSIAPGNAGNTPVQPDQEIWARLANKLPQPLPANLKVGFVPAAGGFRFTVVTGQRETEASFFPAEPDILSNPAPQVAKPTANGITLDLKKDEGVATNPKQLQGLLQLSGGRAYELIALAGPPTTAKAPATPAPQAAAAAVAAPSSAATQSPTTAPAESTGPGLLQAAGLAFLGGLILNLMPCVFPVLFIKGLSLVQSGGEERHKLRTHGFVYAAGILVSFWALVALLLGLRSAGSHLGWGFQFQSPVFLSLMAALLFFLGLSLAGQFEIGLTLTSAGGSLAQKQGYTGSFFTGVLAVIVATPCTAPFMGVALGYALAQSAIVTFAVFTALGSWPRSAVRRADAAASVDTHPSASRRMDGGPQAGRLDSHLRNCHLAGMGSRQRLRRGCARGAACQLPAPRNRRMVSRALAGKGLVCNNRGNACSLRCWNERGCGELVCDPGSTQEYIDRGHRYAAGTPGISWKQLATLVRRSRYEISIPGPPRLRRLHGKLVPLLPGQRARSLR